MFESLGISKNMLPSVAGTFHGTLIICGSGRCVWDDLKKVEAQYLDIMSIKYTFEGNIIGATVYNGTANDNDTASAVAVNSLGEAFIAGESINSSGNADYLVFKCAWDSLQVPAPFTATAAYTEVLLAWQDNSGTEDGFHIQRKDGPCTSANAWALIHTALPDETSHTDKGLNVGQYCYRIQAYQDNGEASRWLEATATTSNPPAPVDLVATAVTTTQIKIGRAHV